jgi:polysaccharide biosynthesis transport protein
MGKNELEAQGVSQVWPVAESGRQLIGIDAPGYEKEPKVELTLATLYRILWEWRWLILSAAAAGLGAAIIVTLLTTPIYRSTAVIELNPPAVEVMANNKQAAPQVSNDRTFIETQHGLLQSRALAERVAQDLNLGSDEGMVPGEMDRTTRAAAATNILQANLAVERVDESRLLRISFSSDDPSRAARIVNGFADSFIRTSLERRYQASSYAREFLERQIANVRRDLENSERRLVAYAREQGIISTGAAEGRTAGDTNSLTGETLISINRALAEAQTRRIAAEQRLREGQRAGNTAEVSDRTSTLRAQRALLQAEYQEKANVFRPDYPEMVRLRSRIESLDAAIASEGGNVRAGRVGTLRAEYQAAAAEENELRGRVNQLRSDVLNLRGRSIEYNIIQRDVDTNRELYAALLQRYREIGVAGGIGVSQASVVDRGQVPGSPYSPNLIFNILVGLLLGLGTGAGLALLLEFINDTIKTPDDVRDRLRLAFLGGIPATKSRKPVEDLRDVSSPISEAYFSAATALHFTTEAGAPRKLLVTSTRPAEGKSTTIWALAQHFARLNNRVLLIDADMRKPAFVTGAEKEDGLSNLLTSREPIRPHVIETGFPNLWLLPCGPLPPNPAELLASRRLKSLLDEARSEFDYVIIDGPPILGLADAPLLAAVCDGTVMVIEAGKTRTRAAYEALSRLRTGESNVVGGILTRYSHEAAGYGYRYEAYSYRSVEKRDREIKALETREDA